MSLFNRKNKETKAPACSCNSECPTTGSICSVKVLGSGCKSCHALLEAAQEAVRSMGLTIEVEYITDMEKIMEYGVMSMPALVVNEQVVSMGKVLKASEVETLLKKFI
ncbi:MAG: thioredoxin family protein [Lachnospiraceae bacterium]